MAADPIVHPIFMFQTSMPDAEGLVVVRFEYRGQSASLKGKPSELRLLFQEAVKWMDRHDSQDYPLASPVAVPFIVNSQE